MKLGDVIYEKRTVTSIQSTVSPEHYDDDVQYKVERVNAVEIPDNATNGYMFLALFPNVTVREKMYGIVWVELESGEEIEFTSTWWNAPFNKKGE